MHTDEVMLEIVKLVRQMQLLDHQQEDVRGGCIENRLATAFGQHCVAQLHHLLHVVGERVPVEAVTNAAYEFINDHAIYLG